jgi:hypothetical protein
VSAAIAAVVSVLVFWLGNRSTRKAAQKERQRQVIEDWFRALSKWVDDYRRPQSSPDYAYHALTSRQIIELSLTRKNRYLAWWMHEMAVAIMLRRKAASRSWTSASSCSSDLDKILGQTGESLLAWHHGELKSSDFNIPYKLHLGARREKVDILEYAEELRLSAFVTPVRMNARRSWVLQKLLFTPQSGGPVVDALQQFLGRRYTLTALAYAFFSIRALQLKSLPKLAYLRLMLKITQKKLSRLERRSESR